MGDLVDVRDVVFAFAYPMGPSIVIEHRARGAGSTSTRHPSSGGRRLGMVGRVSHLRRPPSIVAFGVRPSIGATQGPSPMYTAEIDIRSGTGRDWEGYPSGTSKNQVSSCSASGLHVVSGFKQRAQGRQSKPVCSAILGTQLIDARHCPWPFVFVGAAWRARFPRYLGRGLVICRRLTNSPT